VLVFTGAQHEAFFSDLIAAIPDAPVLVFTGAQHEAFFSDLIAALVSDPARSQFQARAPPV
jgi:hypothetical protein